MSIPVVRRKSDGTLWTPACDTPFPWNGFNFVPAVERTFGWWLFKRKRWTKDRSGPRWVFFDPSLFDILEDTP